MSSQQQEEKQRSVQAFAEEINEVRREALRTMHHYDVATQTQSDPGAIQNRHWEFQSAVVLYLTYLYPYLKGNEVMGQNLNPGGDEAVSLQQIMAEHGSTDTEEIDASDAFDPNRVEEREVPVLQPPNALRNAVHVLNQQALRMGFLPEKAVQDVKDPNPY